MDNQTCMARAAEAAAAVVANVKPDQFDLPTPCVGWDVRTLLNHVTHWSAIVSERTARKLPVPDDGSEDEGLDYAARPDFPDFFAARLDRAVRAWGEPAAWDGEAVMASSPMPAATIGQMVAGELVVHAWDLATATGHDLHVGDDLARTALAAAEGTAAMGREWGMYGPEVTVPATAPALDRLVGLTGRDPAWRP